MGELDTRGESGERVDLQPDGQPNTDPSWRGREGPILGIGGIELHLGDEVYMADIHPTHNPVLTQIHHAKWPGHLLSKVRIMGSGRVMVQVEFRGPLKRHAKFWVRPHYLSRLP